MKRLLRGLLAGMAALLVTAVSAAACPPTVPPPGAAALQAAAQRDRGLLWRIERDGRRSWLYGTLHLGRPEWQAPGPLVAAALEGSQVLALEIDPGDPASQQALGAMTTPAPALPPPLAVRLQRARAAACVDDAALAALHPALQVVLLSMLEARWLGLDVAHAQEQVLAGRARAGGRRIVALETVALQQALLVPGAPDAALAMVEQALGQLETGRARSVMARLASAWEQGDLATLEAYEAWCDCVNDEAERAAMRALNDERNPALADGIAALHAEGRPLFAAVGALHMTGPASLLRLLAARGFRVERVLPSP